MSARNWGSTCCNTQYKLILHKCTGSVRIALQFIASRLPITFFLSRNIIQMLNAFRLVTFSRQLSSDYLDSFCTPIHSTGVECTGRMMFSTLAGGVYLFLRLESYLNSFFPIIFKPFLNSVPANTHIPSYKHIHVCTSSKIMLYSVCVYVFKQILSIIYKIKCTQYT